MTIFQQDPVQWVTIPTSNLMTIPRAELEAAQLQWVIKRFDDLRTAVQTLQIQAEVANVRQVRELADVVPLLFSHQVYKSYPLSLIERGRWSAMTAWLDKMTAHDLSNVDVNGVRSIDDWLGRLEPTTGPMWVFHSTGTTGKLSFYPRSKDEKETWVEANWAFLKLLDPNIRETKLPVFWPAYASGRLAGTRLIEHFGPDLAGSEADFHPMNPEPISADFLSLAMRLRWAQQTGDAKLADMLRGVIKTRGALLTVKSQRARQTKQFFEMMTQQFSGQRVFLMAAATDLLDVAQAGLEQGIEGVFASDSVMLTGGGFKGRDEVADWQNVLRRFYGVDHVHLTYGMTELSTYNVGCSAGHYHALPWNILYVVDPATGEMLPRKGEQHGRIGFFDLLPKTYWGGTLSGDIATVYFGERCECGWTGPWIYDNIMRQADAEGEDRVSCAAVQDTYAELASTVEV